MAIASDHDSPKSVAQELLVLARQEKIRGNFEVALASRVRANEELKRLDASPLDISRNINQMSNLAVQTGDVRLAEECAREALAIAIESSLSLETTATFQMMLACILAEKGNFEEAIQFGNAARENFERLMGSEDEFALQVRRDLRRMTSNDPGPYIERRPTHK